PVRNVLLSGPRRQGENQQQNHESHGKHTLDRVPPRARKMLVRPLGDDAYNDNIARFQTLRRAEGLVRGDSQGKHDVAPLLVLTPDAVGNPIGRSTAAVVFIHRTILSSRGSASGCAPVSAQGNG